MRRRITEVASSLINRDIKNDLLASPEEESLVSGGTESEDSDESKDIIGE